MPKTEITRKAVAFLMQEGAKKVATFGSYARGEPQRASDIECK